MQAVPFLFRSIVDLLIPYRCVKCGIILENEAGLCTSCWPLIPFITKPYCECCGLPFDFNIDEGALCALCSHSPPFFKTARSVFSYCEESKDLILKFKHTDTISSAPLFARWMVRLHEKGENLLCIPVPLHWTRLFMRTYNQAALLAKAMAKYGGWEYSSSYLIRKYRTLSQGNFSKNERIKNVKRAFEVPQKKKKQLLGRKVLLVDDVFTTGATLNACSKVLLKAGVLEVHALTLGRVVSSNQLPLHSVEKAAR
ncbi:MAG: ComF family protein [Alphaproteobacteria bacterium]|nr:ComF family protein [Alphaproteobacteria bacterium]